MTKFNPKRDLPYIAAASQVVQFTIAGYTLFGWVGCVSGLFLGALVSMTVAYATSQYADIAKGRRGWALFFMVVLLSFSPIVVGTAAYISLPFTGIWAGIVAAAWGILPDFSVALDGFIAGKGMVKQDDKPVTQEAPQPRKKPAQAKRKPVSKAEFIAILKSNAGKNDEQLAQILHVSRQAVQQRREKLTPAELGF